MASTKKKEPLVREEIRRIGRIALQHLPTSGVLSGPKRIANIFTRLTELAKSRKFNTKLVDTNLNLSMRLLRAVDKFKGIRDLAPKTVRDIKGAESSLGKLEGSTLELFKQGTNVKKLTVAQRNALNRIFSFTGEFFKDSARRSVLKQARIEFRKNR